MKKLYPTVALELFDAYTIFDSNLYIFYTTPFRLWLSIINLRMSILLNTTLKERFQTLHIRAIHQQNRSCTGSIRGTSRGKLYSDRFSITL